MQRFTYFLPGRAGVNKETICNAGLATIFEPEFSIQSCQVLKHGPNDGGGVAFACNDDKEGAAFARVNMHDQTWIDCGGHWIGFTTNDAPTPDDLARPEAIAALKGYTVKLGDYDWIIPSVNPNHAKPMLPYRRVPKPDGTFAIEVLPKYFAYQSKMLNVWKKFIELQCNLPALSDSMDDDECFDLAISALSIGYRVGVWECEAMKLLDNSRVSSVIMNALDVQEIMDAITAIAAEKKTTGETETSESRPIALGVAES
jgi:hypothetical protein